MKIPETFFEPEVRDGFYIPSEMKRYWASMLEVLGEIDRVCRKYGLKYFADYGTMIGAVRHGGFIPWDDDFDISMFREDYMVFLKVAEKELPEGYKVLSIYNNHKVKLFLGRVVNIDLISTEAEFLRANHNCPYATGIDIFPIDHFEYDESINELQKLLISGVDEMAAVIDEDVCDINELDEYVREKVTFLCDACGSKLEEGKPVKQQMMILSDRIGAIFDKDAPYAAHMYFWQTKGAQVFPKKYFETTFRIPFECTHIPVPAGYDRILCECYGKGYMIPMKAGGIHDYPLYEKQREYMREAVGRVYYPEYAFDENDLKRPAVNTPSREKKEMVFLPFSDRYWKYMEKEWEKYADDPEWDVYVVPIPYFHKKEYGDTSTLCYDIAGYPEYVPITGFDKYDFDKRMPERIVIQNPYDEYDNAITVHQRFYTGLLRAVTKELVYIPYFMTDEFTDSDERDVITSKYYIRVPGVTRADRVILRSLSEKKRYVDELTEFAGADSKSIWEERIIVDESVAPDAETAGLYEDEVPDGWWKYLLKEDNSPKKVILFHVNPGEAAMCGEKYFEKMERVFDIFEKNTGEISVFWQETSGTSEFFEIYYPHLFELYEKMYDRFISSDLGIYTEEDDDRKSVAVADAYYGDRDAIMYKVMKLKKPVMVMNTEV